MRRITSLTAMLSFLMTILTSIILYIVPQGRVAYWADWRLWGLNKEQWGAIHINVGFLFLIFLGLHVYYNWKPLLLYMESKARQVRVFTKEFNIALIIVLVCTLGTYLEIPPFSMVIHVSDGFKDRAAVKYGEPPYGHAELSSLENFSKKTGLDATKAMEAMKKAGLSVKNADQSLKGIAQDNNLSPQQVYEVMKSAAPKPAPRAKTALPDSPPPGTGNLTLKEIADQFGLEKKSMIQALKAKGLDCKGSMTLKETAQANNMGPADVFEMIKEAVGK